MQAPLGTSTGEFLGCAGPAGDGLHLGVSMARVGRGSDFSIFPCLHFSLRVLAGVGNGSTDNHRAIVLLTGEPGGPG